MVRENKCCIQNCPGLYKSRFSIPQHSFNEWQEAVGTPLTKRSRICGAHFSKNYIHDTWTFGEGSNKYSFNQLLDIMELVKIAKTNLRNNLKKKLSHMTANEIEEQSKIITNKVLSHPVYTRSNRVSIYLSMDSEVQTNNIVENIFHSKKTCFIPKYNKFEMLMVEIKSLDEINSLPKTRWNISQPADNDVHEDALTTGGLDLIIVPGLGFTIDGKRLGRGKGYYDRCITEYKKKYPFKNLKTIGLAFSEQICDDIPMSQQDSLIDFLIHP